MESVMISLQQIEISQYCPEEQSTVAIHRRSSTVLSLHSSSQSIFTSRQSGGNRVWAVTGSFKLPSSQHIIGFYNLEAYNAFMVLFGKWTNGYMCGVIDYCLLWSCCCC